MIPVSGKVLGIDHGTHDAGLCVMGLRTSRVYYSAQVHLLPTATEARGERLALLYDTIERVVLAQHPALIAVEQPIQIPAREGKRRGSGLVGVGAGVALAVAGKHHIPTVLVNPGAVKKEMAGSGTARKEQIQEAVRALYGIDAGPDEADAVAVAAAGRAWALEQDMAAQAAMQGGSKR